MKKTVALICLLCICLLSFPGCSSQTGSPAVSHSAENQFMEIFERHAVRCGDRIYFLDYIAKDVTGVFVYELGSDSAIPLCSKPECEHNDKSCGAHLTSGHYSELTAYGDKLYLYDRKGNDANLYSFNPDGTGFTRVMALDIEFERYFQSLDLLAVYNDTVYRCGYGDKVEHADVKKTMTLYSMPLGGDESTEILTVENMTQAIERVCEDKLYCAVFTLIGKNEQEDNLFNLEIYCYDMSAGELEKLYSGEVPFMASVLSVVDDKLMFSFGDIWSYSLTTGELEMVMQADEHVMYLSENRIMETISKTECRIYDLEGNELATFPRKPEEFMDMPCGYYFVGASDDVFYYIVLGEPDNPMEQYNLILAIDARKYETKLLSAVFMGGRVVYTEDGMMTIDEGNDVEITQVKTTHYQGQP